MVHVCFDKNSWALLSSVLVHDAADQVLYCPDYLPVGRLNPFDIESRKAELEALGFDLDESFREDYHAFFDALSEAKEITAWTSRSPHEALGLLMVASLAPIEAGLLACSAACSGGRASACVGLANTERVNEILQKAEPVDRGVLTAQWERLVRENALLRVVIDEAPTSVDEDYFDGLLAKSLDFGPEQAALDAAEAYEKERGGVVSVIYLAERARKILAANGS